jgi:hypothetical protein
MIFTLLNLVAIPFQTGFRLNLGRIFLAHGQTVSEVMARFHRFTQLITITLLNRINCDYLT